MPKKPEGTVEKSEFDWRDMDTAPDNRNIYLTADPDDPGILSYWRRTRFKIPGNRVWQQRCFWAAVLTHRKLDFEPLWWREAVGGAALAAALETAA